MFEHALHQRARPWHTSSLWGVERDRTIIPSACSPDDDDDGGGGGVFYKERTYSTENRHGTGGAGNVPMEIIWSSKVREVTIIYRRLRMKNSSYQYVVPYPDALVVLTAPQQSRT